MFLSEEKYFYLQRLLSKYGEIRKKNHFGGYCFMIDHAIIGLVIDEGFYLRGCLFAQSHFEAVGLKKLLYKKKGVPLELRYYFISDIIWRHEQQFLFYIELAYQSGMEELLQKQKANERIKDLPNMNMAAERALARIGIYNVKEFRMLGAKACFLKLKQFNNHDPGLKLLFELAGAIEGYHCAVLPKGIKQELLSWYQHVDFGK